jgi:CheY-like chemotaxis protein
MASVLIVEDIDDTAAILKDVVLLGFPDWSIDIADSVPQALSRLGSAGVPYDFAILDFILPTGEGIQQGDLSLCAEIRARRLPTRVIHISAYSDDDVIRQHVQDVHLESFDSDFAVSKTTVDWMERVVEKLRTFLHSDRIDAKPENLFPERARIYEARYQLRSSSLGGSVTNRLSDLCADARVHWRYLRNVTKQNLKSRLYVNDSDPDDVRLTLIGEAKSE